MEKFEIGGKSEYEKLLLLSVKKKLLLLTYDILLYFYHLLETILSNDFKMDLFTKKSHKKKNNQNRFH